jgi:hypothetical protein
MSEEVLSNDRSTISPILKGNVDTSFSILNQSIRRTIHNFIALANAHRPCARHLNKGSLSMPSLSMPSLSMPSHTPLTASALHGAWTLGRFIITYSDHRPPLAPLGRDVSGLLVYTPSGWMTATLSGGARPLLNITRLETVGRASVEERAQAFDRYVSYAGRWRLSADPPPFMHASSAESSAASPSASSAASPATSPATSPPAWGEVIHEVVWSLTPNLVGRMNHRCAYLEGEQLTLSYQLTARSGVTRTYLLYWERATAISSEERL